VYGKTVFNDASDVRLSSLSPTLAFEQEDGGRCSVFSGSQFTRHELLCYERDSVNNEHYYTATTPIVG